MSTAAAGTPTAIPTMTDGDAVPSAPSPPLPPAMLSAGNVVGLYVSGVAVNEAEGVSDGDGEIDGGGATGRLTFTVALVASHAPDQSHNGAPPEAGGTPGCVSPVGAYVATVDALPPAPALLPPLSVRAYANA
jgi:hypothetical protein